MTSAAVNNALWGVSLVLQLGLLALVVSRGLARRVVSFTVLVAFYPVRSLVLFALGGRLAPASYVQVYDALAVLGLVLQLAVAAQICAKLVRLRWGWWGAVAVVVGAWVSSVGVVAVAGRSPVPVDRMEAFCSGVMVLLCGWAWMGGAPRVVRVIVAGLAAYGVVDLVASVGKAVAAAHRDARGFAGWAYASSVVYIAVVVLWMVALRD